MSTQHAPNARAIIVKRKKVVKGGGHHGGAWKVAYADFVTAMMAFFLLMWLLNATTEEQRKGIADYFNPTIPMSRISGGGSDALNGDSIFTEDTLVRQGTGATRSQTVAGETQKVDVRKDAAATGTHEEDAVITSELEALQDALELTVGHLADQVSVRVTPEGIIVEIADTDEAPMFDLGLASPTPELDLILDAVAESFGNFENAIKIVGHTDNRMFRNGRLYDNWDLSAERANTARRLLLEAGFDPGRLNEVSGRADTEPLFPSDPGAPQNRRISIIILKPAGGA
jgi:chemotaxis protein MotB